jgi:hypothetical protein
MRLITHGSSMRQIAPLVSALLAAAIMALQGPACAESVPFWGAKASASIDTPIDQLKHGESDRVG